MMIASTALALVAVTAITPGPNNAVVMARGVGGGIGAALPCVVAIALASLLMALFSALAADWLMIDGWKGGLSLIGSTVLVALAIAIWSNASKSNASGKCQVTGLAALFVVQFINPKGWLMMAILVGRLPEGLAQSALSIALVPVITAVCLTIWAVSGFALQRFLDTVERRRLFDRATAAILGLFALTMITNSLRSLA